MAQLRQNTPPVIARIEREYVMLDMRTVGDGDVAALTAAFRRILAP